MTLATKANHAEQPKGHRKYPRTLLVRSDDGDGRDRVGMLLVVIVEGAERGVGPGVSTVQVPHRQGRAGCQPDSAEYRANSDGGRFGLPRVDTISGSLSVTPAPARARAGCRMTG